VGWELAGRSGLVRSRVAIGAQCLGSAMREQ
jgi:hypothetical protein